MNTLKLEKELATKYKYKPLLKEESIKYRQIYKDNIDAVLTTIYNYIQKCTFVNTF